MDFEADLEMLVDHPIASNLHNGIWTLHERQVFEFECQER